ncbi:helix-hairpin-helix domain-containing protein [Microbacterium sp. NPDC077184]|uniref:ComEA family DNA-binding protein n=1 Tax=Microbacterium sp. NPDC077184 TaxID=3154764 RepID=UPI00343313AF
MSAPRPASEAAPSARRWGWGAAVALVLVILVVTIGIGIVRSASAPTAVVPADPPAASHVSDPTGDPARVDDSEIFVHVSGQVQSPGLYVLADGARVVDVVAAAGGFAEGADRAAVNLARPAVDGEQVHIPAPGETPPDGAAAGGGSAEGGPAGDGPLDLNTADAAALDTLPRIGPAIAQRIIEWREQNGPFSSVEDLLAVPGIGEKLLAGLREQVRV